MKFKQILVTMILILLSTSILGCINQEQKQEQNVSEEYEYATASNTPYVTKETSTIKDNREIIITYNGKAAHNIDNENAPPGKIFVIVTMTIENHGYSLFDVNPNYFVLIVDQVAYRHATETYHLDNRISLDDILDGGQFTGNIAFLIPDNNPSKYKLGYKSNKYRNYNMTIQYR